MAFDTAVWVIIMISLHMQVPSPKEISDDQLATMLESGDASQYRVPISLGEPHTVHDNSECLSYWSPSTLALSSQPGKSAVPLMWLWVQRSLSPFRCVCVCGVCGVWCVVCVWVCVRCDTLPM